jgi:Putative metallopeptidase
MSKIITLSVVLCCVWMFSCVNIYSQIVDDKKPKITVKKPTNKLDKGDFKVGFSPLNKNKKAEMPKELKEILQGMADSLNHLMALPYDVYFNFDKCNEPNAFYSSDTKEITMCYEFIEDFYSTFQPIFKVEAEMDSAVDGTVAFFFFHELGHALIDVWDLPATGREEDAVDQLAMLILLDGTPEGEDMVLNGALYFDIASENEDTKNLPFWDEHAFSKQRFYNMLCLTYGSNPEKNKALIGKHGLPKERAVRCGEEFKKTDRAWMRLLEPYLQP